VPTPKRVDEVTALALAAGAGDRVALERFVRLTQRDVWKQVAHLAGVARRNRPSTAAWVDWAAAADQCQALVHDVAAGFEDMVELTALLDQLEPERPEALVPTQPLGLTYAEAAEVCRCPVGTIRSRVARARADLDLVYVQARRIS
jgi:RNA polymerase sigma-70 factor (ECF subfamily)